MVLFIGKLRYNICKYERTGNKIYEKRFCKYRL